MRYIVPEKNLIEFRTSKNDKKKGLQRIPDELYRDPEDHPELEFWIPMSISKINVREASDEDYVERPKTRSKSFYQKNRKENQASLSDFKIIKAIGKVAYGII